MSGGVAGNLVKAARREGGRRVGWAGGGSQCQVQSMQQFWTCVMGVELLMSSLAFQTNDLRPLSSSGTPSAVSAFKAEMLMMSRSSSWRKAADRLPGGALPGIDSSATFGSAIS